MCSRVFGSVVVCRIVGGMVECVLTLLFCGGGGGVNIDVDVADDDDDDVVAVAVVCVACWLSCFGCLMLFVCCVCLCVRLCV